MHLGNESSDYAPACAFRVPLAISRGRTVERASAVAVVESVADEAGSTC